MVVVARFTLFQSSVLELCELLQPIELDRQPVSVRCKVHDMWIRAINLKFIYTMYVVADSGHTKHATNLAGFRQLIPTKLYSDRALISGCHYKFVVTSLDQSECLIERIAVIRKIQISVIHKCIFNEVLIRQTVCIEEEILSFTMFTQRMDNSILGI